MKFLKYIKSIPIHISVFLAVAFSVAAIVSAATTIGTNISTGGNITVSGDITVLGNSTLGNAASDIALFDGALHASSTALFTEGFTTYGNLTVDQSATTTVSFSAAGINFDTNTFVLDPNADRIGILTATPATALDIFGEASTTDLTVASGARIGVGSAAGHLTALDDDTLLVEGNSEFDGTTWFDGILQASSTALFGGDVTLGNAASDVITITGNASTTNAFTVGNNLYVGGFATTSTVNGDFLTDGSIGVGTTSPSELLSISGVGGIMLTNTGSGNTLYIEDSANDTTPFVIDTSGNVGVGSSTPTEALSVSGDIMTDSGVKFDDGTRLISAPTLVRKTADETLSSDTTLQNDDELSFSIAANEIAAFDGALFVTGVTTGDFKMSFDAPNGATALVVGVHSIPVGATSLTASLSSETIKDIGDTISVGTIDTTSTTTVLFKGIVVNGSTAGTVQLQWAQDTSDSTATKVGANSYLIYSKH